MVEIGFKAIIGDIDWNIFTSWWFFLRFEKRLNLHTYNAQNEGILTIQGLRRFGTFQSDQVRRAELEGSRDDGVSTNSRWTLELYLNFRSVVRLGFNRGANLILFCWCSLGSLMQARYFLEGTFLQGGIRMSSWNVLLRVHLEFYRHFPTFLSVVGFAITPPGSCWTLLVNLWSPRMERED